MGQDLQETKAKEQIFEGLRVNDDDKELNSRSEESEE